MNPQPEATLETQLGGWCLCACLCVHVCVSVCACLTPCLCVFVCMSPLGICVSVSVSLCRSFKWVLLCLCLYLCLYASVFVSLCLCLCVQVCVCPCVTKSVSWYVYLCLIRVYLCVRAHVCVCVVSVCAHLFGPLQVCLGGKGTAWQQEPFPAPGLAKAQGPGSLGSLQRLLEEELELRPTGRALSPYRCQNQPSGCRTFWFCFRNDYTPEIGQPSKHTPNKARGFSG